MEKGQSTLELIVAGGIVVTALSVAVFVVIPRIHGSSAPAPHLSSAEAIYLEHVATQQAQASLVTVSPLPALSTATPFAAPPVQNQMPEDTRPTSSAPAVEVRSTSIAAPPLEVVPTAPLVPPAPAPTSTVVSDGNLVVNGSGGAMVPIPIRSSQISLRVSVDPSLSPDHTWGWCFDSSFGLAPNVFDTQAPEWLLYCGMYGVFNPATGYRDAFKTITIEASWQRSARYFLHMMCLSSCVWQVEVQQ